MFFSVDDSFVLGSSPQVRVAVEYLDSGVNVIDLKHLDAGGQEIGSLYRIHLTGGTGFKTAEFVVSCASFANRMSFANDLRLDGDLAGGMVIKSVSVSRTAPPTGGSAIPALLPGHTRVFVPVGYKGGCGS
jgi:hypothetical protein